MSDLDTPGRDPRAASLGDLYPFTSHFHEVLGGRMHYLDEGAGPTVVMLHGNPTWSFYYRELIKGLRDRYRVIVPDHIGCGLSDKPPEYPYTLATHIENLHVLLNHLDVHDVTLVVHDWGGPIGFGWAVRDPARLRRLVVLNTAAFLGGTLPLRIRLCRWPVLGDVAVLRFNVFARAATRMACRRRERMTDEVRRGYLLPYDTPGHRVGVLCFARDIPLHPQAASYRVVQKIEAGLAQFRDRPMLIAWGMRDFCFTESFLNEWITRFPQAEVQRFKDAGHYVVEDEYERLIPLIRDFLGRT